MRLFLNFSKRVYAITGDQSLLLSPLKEPTAFLSIDVKRIIADLVSPLEQILLRHVDSNIGAGNVTPPFQNLFAKSFFASKCIITQAANFRVGQ